MDEQKGLKGKLERDRRLGTAVWVWYLSAGAALAVTRVALFLWLVHRAVSDTRTELDSFLLWLYPEAVVSIFWNSLVGFSGTKYYLAWGSLFALGSFVMATPILLVGWLRQRRR